MLVSVLLSLVTLVFCKPPPYLKQNSIYDNLPYLIDRIQLPPDEEVTNYDTLLTEKDWPGSSLKFGQVAGVDTDKAGDVHVFHRAERAWTAESFGYGDIYQQRDLGPIQGDTLLVLDKESGAVKIRFGSNKFYMPHGLTIDHEENMWLTDVALHQVFKYPKGASEASFVLGKEFEPGHDDTHFCKPTDVAVASNGVFFVADGYCNSRVMKFSPYVTLLSSSENSCRLTLIESQDLLCVADREHGSTALSLSLLLLTESSVFRAGLRNANDTGNFVVSVSDPEMAKVYAVAYDPNENLMYAVNGGFSTPHDLAVSPNGKHVYVAEIGPNRLWKLDRVKL
ncbi:LOW QUALITY PROTEIN: peptidyl-alpha-hydroxyglycine alpha-amidating lyase 2-like [Liolophura sinensis]|uniref:LOW QUALITY PROTEIN: peptidyl-alpha-hydroxyglycine alpha-amidating lyase 2-like n=1 Tax=Liolophura sinensis TaxID=3198878 RepID=UPI0031591B47